MAWGGGVSWEEFLQTGNVYDVSQKALTASNPKWQYDQTEQGFWIMKKKAVRRMKLDGKEHAWGVLYADVQELNVPMLEAQLRYYNKQGERVFEQPIVLTQGVNKISLNPEIPVSEIGFFLPDAAGTFLSFASVQIREKELLSDPKKFISTFFCVCVVSAFVCGGRDVAAAQEYRGVWKAAFHRKECLTSRYAAWLSVRSCDAEASGVRQQTFSQKTALLPAVFVDDCGTAAGLGCGWADVPLALSDLCRFADCPRNVLPGGGTEKSHMEHTCGMAVGSVVVRSEYFGLFQPGRNSFCRLCHAACGRIFYLSVGADGKRRIGFGGNERCARDCIFFKCGGLSVLPSETPRGAV